MEKQYVHLSRAERDEIFRLLKGGISRRKIATILGRDVSTVSREIARNQDYLGYLPDTAERKTAARRIKGTFKIDRHPELKTALLEGLAKRWSPEDIAAFCYGKTTFCHETIYRHVWQDKFEGGDLHGCLRQATKLRRKRHNSYDRRGRLSGKRHISERPAFVETRLRMGHWEIDTVVGGGEKDCVVTLVERKTGYAMIGKLADRSAGGMARRVTKLIRRHDGCFRTITSDNGTEFHDYAKVEKATDVLFYFATPYHSWERGTNENLNGLLRQYLPKRKSQAHLTQVACDALASQLNQRPRKRLGYRTPEECFNEC